MIMYLVEDQKGLSLSLMKVLKLFIGNTDELDIEPISDSSALEDVFQNPDKSHPFLISAHFNSGTRDPQLGIDLIRRLRINGHYGCIYLYSFTDLCNSPFFAYNNGGAHYFIRLPFALKKLIVLIKETIHDQLDVKNNRLLEVVRRFCSVSHIFEAFRSKINHDLIHAMESGSIDLIKEQLSRIVTNRKFMDAVKCLEYLPQKEFAYYLKEIKRLTTSPEAAAAYGVSNCRHLIIDLLDKANRYQDHFLDSA